MKELRVDKSISNRDHDSLKGYFNDINKFPLLSAEDEVLLAVKIKEGDRSAFNKLVNSNLRFVVSVAKKYEGNGILLTDLIAEGNIGLMKAAEKFDPTRGFKFISFAVWWMRQAMMQAINDHKRLVRLPGHRIRNQHDVWNAESVLEQVYERPATHEEIAEYLELPLEHVKDTYMDSMHSTSLDDYDPDRDQRGLLEVMAQTMFSPADAELIAENINTELHAILMSLPERQKLILQMQFGLRDDYTMSLDDIASRLEVSQQCVSINKKKAITTLGESRRIKALLY
ncbi:sigma-70 family RNA polymerase sigma factor [Pedobacter sp. JY14-1]|uniref:sigma-70 family RNA polymerase sigma factor n=1 Tax=Pedobacter sp. JY14-1 TaxID=3034151 RepID=UPI0023E2DE25|nr:sigma-70 family RNA polymerase sigma factor [Pedobacter sp. JY14-1]